MTSTADMMIGPMNNPISPKACKPPKMPTSASRNGRRAALPTRAGPDEIVADEHHGSAEAEDARRC
jgi:hypothetical protein